MKRIREGFAPIIVILIVLVIAGGGVLIWKYKLADKIFPSVPAVNSSLTLNPISTAPKYNFEEYLTPFWATTTMYNESVLMVSTDNGAPEAFLLFPPTKILSVKDSHLSTEYVEGVDWKYDNGKLKLLPGSSAAYLTNSDLYPSTSSDHAWDKVGGGYVLFYNSPWFHDRQLAVTYTHESNLWKGPIPQFQSSNLSNTINKLKNGLPLKIVLYGDSIAAGGEASGYTGVAPNMPSWGQLIVKNLEKHYSSSIAFKNPSQGGMDSTWGKDNVNLNVTVENPDLVILAFGMNDGTKNMAQTTYKKNMQAIIDDVRAKNPKAEFILVATTLSNSELTASGNQTDYMSELQELAGVGITIADMTEVHRELLKHKLFRDMTGNNINHPNDFLIRWYAQQISGQLIRFN